MKRIHTLLISAALAVGSFLNAAALSGSWRGDLSLGMMKLPLVFNFMESPDGKVVCTLDSPNQGAKGIPTTVAHCSTDSLAIDCTMIGATFRGHITSTEISGTFSQSGHSFPLVLSPDTDAASRRPQTPRPPFPYQEKDTVFTSADGTELSGTLVLPEGVAAEGSLPGVILVSGSGAQNRDEELFEHRPFAVIADFLARRGIASFRYDDRGTAKSKGDFAGSTTFTFKDDAEAALSFLRSFPQIGRAGVAGHSEGGTIAFMLASEQKPDFIISLAGLAEPAMNTLLAQNRHALVSAGIAGEDLEEAMKLVQALLEETAKRYRNNDSSPIDIQAVIQTSGVKLPQQLAEALANNTNKTSKWFGAFLNIDPAIYLKEITCPVLAINGTVDTQVDADRNLSIIKKLVPDADTRRMDGLNHLMQHARTGEVAEYGEITETIAPEVLEAIATFCKR